MNLDYGSYWINQATNEWYDSIYGKQMYIHNAFKEWCKEKTFDSIFEVGAGRGHYSEYFAEKNYSAIDMTPLLQVRKNHTSYYGDFTYHVPEKKYDLVFSHSVIDHVPDPDKFIEKCLNMSKKHVYITHYNGFDESITSHVQTWDDSVKCYFNVLSLQAIRNMLDGKNYKIDKLVGYRDSTVIIIEL